MPYGHGHGDASGQTLGLDGGADQRRDGASYPRMLTQFNGQFAACSASCWRAIAPLAFNCTAGKDRTGIAAALLLTALGAARAKVIEDYLLTNQTLHIDGAMAASQASGSFLAQLPPAIAHPFMIADRRYIEAALAVVDSHKDGASGYLRDELGLAPTDLARLRHLYLN
jgi:protein-tyrosine phosphatase